jgi:hypothetical protein
VLERLAGHDHLDAGVGERELRREIAQTVSTPSRRRQASSAGVSMSIAVTRLPATYASSSEPLPQPSSSRRLPVPIHEAKRAARIRADRLSSPPARSP